MRFRNNRRRKKKKRELSEDELALLQFQRNYALERQRKRKDRLIQRMGRKAQRERVTKPSPVREE